MSTSPAHTSARRATTRQIPSKPIERAFIRFPGDPAAGLRDQDFTAEIWIDPGCVGEDSFWGWLSVCRHKIASAYSEMIGDGQPSVTFDFELDARAAREGNGDAPTQ